MIGFSLFDSVLVAPVYPEAKNTVINCKYFIISSLFELMFNLVFKDHLKALAQRLS